MRSTDVRSIVVRSIVVRSIVVAALASFGAACGSDADTTATSAPASSAPANSVPANSAPANSAPASSGASTTITQPATTDPETTDPETTDPATSGTPDASGSTLVVGEAPAGSPSTVYPAGDVNPDLGAFIVLAVEDLSAQIGIDQSAITTHSAVLVVWADSSLGCAEKGIQYTQVQTDGALIELSVGSANYRYHAGGSTNPFLCSQPITTAPTRLD